MNHIYRNFNLFTFSFKKNFPKECNHITLRHCRTSRRASNSIVENSPKELEVPDLNKNMKSTKPLYLMKTRKEVNYPSPSVPKLPSEFREEEILKLNDEILLSPDCNTIFKIYLREKSTFELSHYVLSLQRLSQICKESSNFENNLHENKVFQSICYDIWRATPQFEVSTVLCIYKHLLDMKVESNSLIIQSLLQMARHQINLYSIKNLLFLHVLLRNTDKCSLKDALEEAIPKVVENSLNLHFPSHLKFGQMSQLLYICIVGKVKGLQELLNYIHSTSLPELLVNEKNDSSLQSKVSSLLINLCELDTLPEEIPDLDAEVIESLMINCLNILIEKDVHKIEKRLLIILLRKLKKFYLKTQNDCVLNDEFFSKVARRCLTENWDLKSQFQIIKYLSKLHHVSEELVSFVASKLEDEISSVEVLEDLDFNSFLSALAVCDLPKEISNKAVNLVLKNMTLPFDNLKISWINFTLTLLYLNYFDLNVLKRILHEDFLSRFLKIQTDTTNVNEDLNRLNKYLKCFDETRELEVPSKFLIPPQKPSEFTELRNLFVRIIGRDDFILSSVLTPQGNYIDHILVLEDEGKLVNLKDLEQSRIFNKNTGMKRIAIMEVPETFSLQPGLKLHISCKIDFHLIEQEGFIVLPVFEREINDLREASFNHIRTKLEKIGICLKK